MKKQSSLLMFLLVSMIAFSPIATDSATAEGSTTILWEGIVWDMNDHCQVVGYDFSSNAVMWDKGGLTVLWESGEVEAINNRGQAVGIRRFSSYVEVVMWDKGELITLYSTESEEHTIWPWALAINNRGQVVGYFIDFDNDEEPTAWLWNNGEFIILWEIGYAVDINEHGQVVGFKWDAESQQWDYMLWENGETISLGLPAPPVAINNRGQIVGGSGGSAYFWDNGEVIPLSFLPRDMNDRGQVVGLEVGPTSYRAVLWDRGQLTVLSEGPSSAHQARCINNRGQIAGSTAGQKVVLWEK